MASPDQNQLVPAEQAQPASEAQPAHAASPVMARLSATHAAFGNVLTSGSADNAPHIPRNAPRRWKQGVFDFSSQAPASDDQGVETPDAAPVPSVDQSSRLPTSHGQVAGASEGPLKFNSLYRSSRRGGILPRSNAPKYARGLFDSVPDDSERAQPESLAPPVGTEWTRSLADRRLPNELPASVGIASGEMAKARDILAAVRALQHIERQQRTATPDEQAALARFAGFGPVALSIFPDPVTGRFKDPSWQSVGEDLKSLLSPDEYDSARRTTFNAFYTSATVITAMHAALARLGVPGNATILEPGCGIGNFVRYGRTGHRFIGVELDQISGRIARALHPHHDIRIENFRDTRLSAGSVDAVIGNVPFADMKLEYLGQKWSLHDFFFAKSIDVLKPGGALALVTTHFTLDKQNAAIRQHLASQANFIGAIRLPSNAFKREGTAVVADIIFLRKRSLDEPPNHCDPDWLEVGPLTVEGMEVLINGYFLNHPEMVLGHWSRKHTLYGEGYSVEGSGELARQLQDAIQRLPEFAPLPPSPNLARSSPTLPLPPPERHVTEGSFFIDHNRLVCQLLDGDVVPVVYGGTKLRAGGSLTGRRLVALIGLRDLARRVLQSQNEGWPEAERNESRRELNGAYDRFVWAYGPINKTTTSGTAGGGTIRRMPNLVKFREDPDAMLVMSLENYDEASGTAAKAPIMYKDVVGKTPPVTSVRSAEEGLLVSLDRRGTVDLPFIAALYGKPEEQVIVELGDLIFPDPESKTWQTADAYLSGNVRAKLAAALQAGSAYVRNAERLQLVQPEDVLPGDIDANLGAPWIPEGDIQTFAAALFNVESTAIRVGHLVKDAVWSIDADAEAQRSVAATSGYGTPRSNGTSLLELALNMKTPVIYDTIDHGDREERIVNQEATVAAREKLKLIKEAFRTWLFTDADRTERLVRLYNDTYNNLRPRLFDGSH
ncbi:MAG: hypothetical protein ACKV0T_16310, partial [Planctomycetales bacterium]